MAQLLAGVSSRRYRDSLETGVLDLPVSGGSRSAVSRQFVARTWRTIKAWLNRPLNKVSFVRHLPKQMHTLVDRTMVQAYQCGDGKRARKILRRLINSLKEAYPGAARSLEEGLDETLTVVDLGLPQALRQSLQTTNLMESAFSVVRQVSMNVKRWRNGRMAERWAALGLIEAEKRFRKIRGYRHLPMLIAALQKRKKHLTKARLLNIMVL